MRHSARPPAVPPDCYLYYSNIPDYYLYYSNIPDCYLYYSTRGQPSSCAGTHVRTWGVWASLWRYLNETASTITTCVTTIHRSIDGPIHTTGQGPLKARQGGLDHK